MSSKFRTYWSHSDTTWYLLELGTKEISHSGGLRAKRTEQLDWSSWWMLMVLVCLTVWSGLVNHTISSRSHCHVVSLTDLSLLNQSADYGIRRSATLCELIPPDARRSPSRTRDQMGPNCNMEMPLKPALLEWTSTKNRSLKHIEAWWHCETTLAKNIAELYTTLQGHSRSVGHAQHQGAFGVKSEPSDSVAKPREEGPIELCRTMFDRYS